jgi:hypothetical protein
MQNLIRIFYFVTGVAFAQIAGPYFQQFWDQAHDTWWCEGTPNLKSGKLALAAAINDNRPELFRDAKMKFAKAATCLKGGEALFLEALLYCDGLGGEKDPPRAWHLLREAAGREPKWALEVLANPNLCKLPE